MKTTTVATKAARIDAVRPLLWIKIRERKKTTVQIERRIQSL
jgi:hypothetical protein